MTSSDLVITLPENGTVLTRDLTATQAARLAHLPPDELAVQLGPAPGEYRMTAGNKIGVILGEGLHIRIEPKVPIANLFTMLTYADGLDYFREPQAPLGRSEDLFEFIVRMFVHQVDRLVRQGIQRGYVDFEEPHPFLRGRLLLGEHLRHTLTRPSEFHQRTNEFTADLLENRILHETLSRLGRAPGLGAGLRHTLRRAASAFAEVPPAHITPADCDAVLYTRLNERYRPAVVLARLLLQYLALESHTGRTPFATYLLPMALIFEQFIAAYLSQARSLTPDFSVAAQKRLTLDHGGRVTGYLDVLLERAGRPALVLDTKYKVYGEKPSNADLYQMAAYAQTVGVAAAVLLYPGEAPPDAPIDLKLGIRMHPRALPLTGTLAEFRAACERLVGWLVGEMVPV
jgi:5-methylcytosine-specific restriction enzyme subunit McrC